MESVEWPRNNLKLYSSAEMPLGTMESSAESPVQAAVVADFNERLKTVKDLYEQRVSTITEHSKRFLQEAKTDDVIKTMRESHVSEQFAAQRMKELHDEAMAREREETIERLTQEVSQHRGETARLSQDLQRVTAALRTAEDFLRLEKGKSEDLRTQLQRLQAAEEKRRREFELGKRSEEAQVERLQSRRAQEQVQRLETQFRSANEQLEALSEELESEKGRREEAERAYAEVTERFEEGRRKALQAQTEQTRQLQRARKEIEQLTEELNSIHSEKSDIMEHYTQYEHQVKEALVEDDKKQRDVLEGIKRKFKAKSRLFKKKITEQKAALETLSAELHNAEERLEAQQHDWEVRSGAVQDDLRRVRDEWERKCQEVQLEAKRKEAEFSAKHNLQLSSLRAQYQQQLDLKVNELQSDLDAQAARVRSQESEMRRTMEQKLQEVEREHKDRLDHLIRDQQLLSSQELELRLRTQREMAAVELGAVQKDLDRAKAEVETFKAAGQTRKTEVEDFRRQLEESIQVQRTLTQKLEEASDNLAVLRQARDSDRRKAVQTEAELERLTADVAEKEKLLSRVAKEVAAWQEAYPKLDADRKKAVAEAETAFNEAREAVEREREQRSRFQEQASQLARLQSEITEIEKRLNDQRLTQRTKDQELLQMKQQLLDSHMNAAHTQKREQQRRIESESRWRDALHAVLQQLQALRSELTGLKAHAEGDLRLGWQELSAQCQALSFEVLDQQTAFTRTQQIRLRQTEESLELQYADRVRELETELSLQTNSTLSSLQEQMQAKDRHLEALRSAAQQLKRDNQALLDEAERAHTDNAVLRAQVEEFTVKLKANSRAFDDLQHEVQLEAARLRAESETLRREVANKSEEATTSQRLLDDLRRRVSDETRGGQEEVRRLRDQQALELADLKRKYEKAVDQVAAERDLERERGTKLRSQASDLRVRVDALQTQMERGLKTAEEQVRVLERNYKEEEEHLMQAKLEKAADLTALSERLLQVTEELRTREQQCVTLQQERRGLAEHTQDLETQVHVLMQELADLRSAKDREIDSLRGLVSRSYSDSMDQVRKARELDRDTKELAAQIRKPPTKKQVELPERGK